MSLDRQNDCFIICYFGLLDNRDKSIKKSIKTKNVKNNYLETKKNKIKTKTIINSKEN